MKGLFGEHIQLTDMAMGLHLQRQNVVMANLANIKTPGYRARRLEFEEELQRAMVDKGTMTRTDDKHLPVTPAMNSVNPEMRKEFKPRVIQGEDAVNLDKEMAAMAKNTLLYKALATALRKNFEGLKAVIREGAK